LATASCSYNAKFGGMTAANTRRLRTVESGNRKLKALLAEAMLANALLKDLTSKPFGVGTKRNAVRHATG